MRRRNVAISLAIVAVVAFFFLAPAVPMNIIPCFNGGSGYASLSYRLFYVGEIYLGGHFSWANFNDQDCNGTVRVIYSEYV
jgi:hypothetical protein